MKFAYTILYVRSVEASLSFYQAAFGFPRRFLHESGMYGELDTGDTTLAFASLEMSGFNFPEIGMNLPDSTKSLNPSEIAFSTDTVEKAFDTAVLVGATPVTAPAEKPWGQTVAYLRDPDGHLVELCTPMA